MQILCTTTGIAGLCFAAAVIASPLMKYTKEFDELAAKESFDYRGMLVVENRSAEEANVAQKAAELMKTGVDLSLSESSPSGVLRFSSRDTKQCFAYDPQNSEFTFWDATVEFFTDADRSDTASMQRRAKNHLRTLLGEEAESYVARFVDVEKIAKKDGDEKICGLGYWFAPVIDGRVVAGTTSYIRIYLGAGGKIHNFHFKYPKFTKTKNMEKKLKPTAFRKVLEKRTASFDYLKHYNNSGEKPKEIEINRMKPTFVSCEKNGTTYLVPHITVETMDILESGKPQWGAIHISLDADAYPDGELDKKDIE